MPVNDVDVLALLQRVESLEARVHALEAGTGLPVQPVAPGTAAIPAAAVPQGAASTVPAAEISEEMLTVIGAAIGAFLGVKVRIKQVKMVRSDVWAQQGRASIMASHGFATMHR